MRIALVCPYDWARPGGVQGHIAQLGAYLAHDHKVLIVTPSHERSSGARRRLAAQRPAVSIVGRPVPVRYNQSIAPIALSPQAARKALRELGEFAPHIVHVHEPFAPMVSAAAAAFGPRPVIATFHAWSASNRAYRLVAPVARRVAARLDARVAVSPAAQEFAAAALGIAMGAIRVIPNGVDVASYASAQPIPELIDRDRPLLLFVGRLEPRKGLDVAVRAFLRLRSSNPGVRLCVVGEGPERERCQQMVPTALRPDVLFVGRVDEADKARYHASADLYIAPNSGGESFGIVLLEAMAAGLPVVASDIPGYRSVVREGRQGRLVPPGDAFAFAEAAATLLANDRLRSAMAEEGRRTAAEYDWAIVGGRIEQLYRAVRRARR